MFPINSKDCLISHLARQPEDPKKCTHPSHRWRTSLMALSIGFIVASCDSSQPDNPSMTASGVSSTPRALILEDGSQSTVATADSNENGIWDEFDTKIALLMQINASGDSALQGAIEQSVKAAQEVMMFGADESSRSIQEVGNQMKESSQCLTSLIGENISALRPQLDLMLYTTEARSQARTVFSQNSVGQYFSAETTGSENCE